MVDQFNSHAQIGVAITIHQNNNNDKDNNDDNNNNNNDDNFENKNRLAHQDQNELLYVCGSALGHEFRRLLFPYPTNGNGSNDDDEKTNNHNNHTTSLLTTTTTATPVYSRFLCPLDEALVECRLRVVVASQEEEGRLDDYTLEPYGGRTRVGWLQTHAVRRFFDGLAQTSGLSISLVRIRGRNGHHIVESSFKALSRALRNLLDQRLQLMDNNKTTTNVVTIPGLLLEQKNKNDSLDSSLRIGRVERQTKETSISISLGLNGHNQNSVTVSTGLPVLNALYAELAQRAGWSLEMQCRGDLWIDDHHTTEDVSIALGQALYQALGNKAGLNRMWCAQQTISTHNTEAAAAVVEAVVDLSNRPELHHNLVFCKEYLQMPKGTQDKDDDSDDDTTLLSTEMVLHALESLVVNARITVHLVVVMQQEEDVALGGYELAMAAFGALGEALRACCVVDPRRAGKTASSKGTLSV